MTWQPKYTGVQLPLLSLFFESWVLRLLLCVFVYFRIIQNPPVEMAESPVDAAAVNTDTMRLELEKTMTDILDDGGVSKDPAEIDGTFGVSKIIDEASRLLDTNVSYL